MFEFIAAISGVIATVWITIGVYIAAKYYPNYSHSNQFCSELGASGSPTEKLSPLINNYPLSLIFGLFGWHITQLPDSNLALTITGWLVIFHGLGTLIAGYFPMDKDPYTEEPSFNCNVHSIAGLVMLLTLMFAPILLAFSPESHIISFEFRVFSVLAVILSVYYVVKLAKAFKAKEKAGLYQRVSYWIQLVWLSSFSLLLAQV
ncbi:DUF998 domain-containing protein [Marinobacterium arenosum]|uniref:DUF998 domain-containing protein n=1 Tax=Marinobacterium arenosum TaxID=2862496 RepID=UPI001C98883D|nr:DUF998 domain-containing protein [Marinobacterium arenosum]MBY4678717.1 DUF998 domain-containing protein [Marinobacterium arenosum]